MIHLLADVQSKNIGAGTAIWQFCVILPGAKIGCDCNICSHVFIENEVLVGNGVVIKNGVQIWDGVTIGDGVFIGPNATFTNDRFPRAKRFGSDGLLQTEVASGASIGANTTILPGLKLGAYCFVAAGSVVTRDVAAHSLVVGCPAVHQNWVCKCAKVLSFVNGEAICCGHSFRESGSELEAIYVSE